MRPGRLIALGFLAALAAGCVPAPVISWAPQPLAVAIEPNAYRIYEVSLRAPVAVASLELVPSDALRPVVSVIPQTLANVDAGSPRRVRLAFLLPPTARPGQRIAGRLEGGLQITVDVIPPTAEGVLESMRVALEVGDETAYLAQVSPSRRAAEQRTFAVLTDTARLALAQTLQTAERISLAGRRAEYRIYLLLDKQQVESSIELARGPDGIWRVVRF